MKPIEAFKSVLSNYATFSGRACRSEYWYFVAISDAFITCGTKLLGSIPGIRLMFAIISLILVVPTWAVTIRRLHDVGKSGWLLVIRIILSFIVLGLIIAYLAVEISNVSSTGILSIALKNATRVSLIVLFVYYLYFLFLTFQDSQPGDNKYGPNPKGLDGTNNL